MIPFIEEVFEPMHYLYCKPMYFLYCDESGKHPQSSYIAVCGYIIHREEIFPFSRDWNHCTENTHKVQPIHMREIFHPSQKNGWLSKKMEWGERWEFRRDGMLVELAYLVQNHSLRPVGTVMEAKDKSKSAEHVYTAFKHTVLSTIVRVSKLTSDLRLGIVMDDDPDTVMAHHEWINRAKREDAVINNAVKSICFSDDKLFPTLQAADMLAYDSRARCVGLDLNPDEPPSERYRILTNNLAEEPNLIREQ